MALEYGGSNDIANLWPKAAEPRPGFHEKDRVENYAHDQVCAGRMSLLEAQHASATNWLEVYARLRQPGMAAVAPTLAPAPQPAPASAVWSYLALVVVIALDRGQPIVVSAGVQVGLLEPVANRLPHAAEVVSELLG